MMQLSTRLGPRNIIIDDEGEVVASTSNDKKVGGNLHEVVRIISACKLCDEEGAWSNLRGTPSDWKPGMELVTTMVGKVETVGDKEATTTTQEIVGEVSEYVSTSTGKSIGEDSVDEVKLAPTLNDHLEEAEKKKQDDTKE